jgi:hypothetical protein
MTSEMFTSCKDHPTISKASALKDLALVRLDRLAFVDGFQVMVAVATGSTVWLVIASGAIIGD